MKKEELLLTLIEKLFNENDKNDVIHSLSSDESNLFKNYIGKICIVRTYSAGVFFAKIRGSGSYIRHIG